MHRDNLDQRSRPGCEITPQQVQLSSAVSRRWRSFSRNTRERTPRACSFLPTRSTRRRHYTSGRGTHVPVPAAPLNESGAVTWAVGPAKQAG